MFGDVGYFRENNNKRWANNELDEKSGSNNSEVNVIEPQIFTEMFFFICQNFQMAF